MLPCVLLWRKSFISFWKNYSDYLKQCCFSFTLLYFVTINRNSLEPVILPLVSFTFMLHCSISLYLILEAEKQGEKMNETIEFLYAGLLLKCSLQLGLGWGWNQDPGIPGWQELIYLSHCLLFLRVCFSGNLDLDGARELNLGSVDVSTARLDTRPHVTALWYSTFTG